MIHVLKPSPNVPLADQIQSIVQAHGSRAVLLALMRASVRLRRAAPIRVSEIPLGLRRDVGLPPEPYAPPRIDRPF